MQLDRLPVPTQKSWFVCPCSGVLRAPPLARVRNSKGGVYLCPVVARADVPTCRFRVWNPSIYENFGSDRLQKGAMIGFGMPALLRRSMYNVPVQRCYVCRCDGEIMKECRRLVHSRLRL